jgi:hypothetical protein
MIYKIFMTSGETLFLAEEDQHPAPGQETIMLPLISYDPATGRISDARSYGVWTKFNPYVEAPSLAEQFRRFKIENGKVREIKT